MAKREIELMEKALIGPGGFGKERQLSLPLRFERFEPGEGY